MELSIMEAARITGMSTDTLRFYDKEGMVVPKRKANGYRFYTEGDILILKNIVVMKYAHFTLKEMKALEEVYKQKHNTDCAEIGSSVLSEKVTELKRTVANYQRIIRLLEQLLAMVESSETYIENEVRISEFINQIFESIKDKRYEFRNRRND